jgi:hypothetical protein
MAGRSPLASVATAAARAHTAAARLDTAREERDAAIAAAFEAGASIGDIARAAGVSPGRVSRLLGYPHQRVGRPAAAAARNAADNPGHRERAT